MLRMIAAAVWAVCLLAIPQAQAARRVALLVDMRTPTDQAAIAASRALAQVLKQRFGFDVIEATDGARSEAGLKQNLQVFTERAAGAEMALLYFAGRAEHDRNATLLLPRDGADANVNLDDLLRNMANGSKASIAFLDLGETALAAGQRRPGIGRMPVMDGKLLVAITSNTMTTAGKPKSLLAAALEQRFEPRPLPGLQLVNAVRDDLYLVSAGLAVVRTFGSLPRNFRLDPAADRDGLIAAFQSRARQLCETDYAQSPPATIGKLLGHIAAAARWSQPASLDELDTFSLESYWGELQKASLCLYQPAPVVAPPGVAASVPQPSIKPASMPPAEKEPSPAKPKSVSAPPPEKEPPAKERKQPPTHESQQAERKPDPPPRRERPDPPVREREQPPARQAPSGGGGGSRGIQTPF